MTGDPLWDANQQSREVFAELLAEITRMKSRPCSNCGEVFIPVGEYPDLSST